MNDSSYTILIPALLLLLAASVGMLYARFASRSTEISEEIDLVDIDLAKSSISAAETKEEQSAADDTQRVPFLEPRLASLPVLEMASSDDSDVDASSDDETEYFDELQEAAAGLAALMRSSPVGRTTPVVYAPEDLEEEAEEAVGATAHEDEPREILLPVSQLIAGASDSVEPLVEAEDGFDDPGEKPTASISLEESEVGYAEVDAIASGSTALLETDLNVTREISNHVIEDSVISNEVTGDAVGVGTEPLNVVIDDITISEDDKNDAGTVVENSDLTDGPAETVSDEPESRVLSLRALLGDEVADQFDSLDEGLRDLENLVDSIELALSSINEGVGDAVADDLEAISEAA